MHRTRRFLLIVSMFVGAAGAACPAPTQSPPGNDGVPLPVTRLRTRAVPFTYYAGITDSLREVVRDSSTWLREWTRIHAGVSPLPSLPRVDFAREIVVVAALGRRPSAGYDLLIDSAYRASDAIVVVVRRSAPGAHCVTPAVVTHPLDIARIPASELPVRFRERSSVESCQ